MTERDSRPGERRSRPPIHKRQYIVDKPFQYRLIGTLMSIWLAYSLFFTIVLYFFYEGHLKQFYTLGPQPGLQPLLTLSMLFTLSMVFVYVFGFIVLSIVAIYMSNQIAGPLYRTKLSMERIGRGDLAFRLQFRQGDFLNDIPGIFNAMLDGIKRQAQVDVEQVHALEKAANDPVTLKRLLRELRQRKEAAAGVESREVAAETPQPVSVTVS
jgi:methyl-accepting chemotaxis protein